MSIFYDILSAVKDDIETVLIPYGVPISLRRRNIYLQDDPLPIVVVAPGDTEYVDSLDFDSEVTWVYPIIINMIYPDNRNSDLALDAQEYLDIREAIRNRIYYPLLAGVPEVWDVDENGTKPFTLVDQKSTYSSTQWIAKYKSLEPRRSS